MVGNASLVIVHHASQETGSGFADPFGQLILEGHANVSAQSERNKPWTALWPPRECTIEHGGSRVGIVRKNRIRLVPREPGAGALFLDRAPGRVGQVSAKTSGEREDGLVRETCASSASTHAMTLKPQLDKAPVVGSAPTAWGVLADTAEPARVIYFDCEDGAYSYPYHEPTRWVLQAGEPEHVLINAGRDSVIVTVGSWDSSAMRWMPVGFGCCVSPMDGIIKRKAV